jgi:N-acetylneuraminic acid mutarotase
LRKPVLAGRAAEAAGWFWVVERDVHAFNGDTWNFAPRLQSPRAGGALVTIADGLYFVEGATGRAAPMEVLKPQR